MRARLLPAAALLLAAALLSGCAGGTARDRLGSLLVVTAEPVGTPVTLAEERLPDSLTPVQEKPTDAQGSVLFESIPPGQYVVALFNGGQLVRRSPAFGVASGPNRIEFR